MATRKGYASRFNWGHGIFLSFSNDAGFQGIYLTAMGITLNLQHVAGLR